MDKYTFVNELHACLKGKIDQRELEDTLKYYRDYIDMEIRKGKTEAEVLDVLGSPRLLAKTIIDAKGNGTSEVYEETVAYERAQEEKEYGRRRIFKMPLWLASLIFFFVLILLISFLFKVVTILAPVILIFVAIGLVMKLIKDGK